MFILSHFCLLRLLPLLLILLVLHLSSPDTSMYIIEMSVRLDQPFHEDLVDSSSALFKKYKHDLEEAV